MTVSVETGPRKDVLALVAGQARFRYEVDDPTLAKADVDLGQPMTPEGRPASPPATPWPRSWAAVGLSYRSPRTARLFITTAARLAAETGKKAVIEGPPVKLTLSPADRSRRTRPTARLTRDAYARRLAAQGMRTEVVQTYLDQYARSSSSRRA